MQLIDDPSRAPVADAEPALQERRGSALVLDAGFGGLPEEGIARVVSATARTTFVQAEGDEVRARYGVLLQGLNVGYARGDLGGLLQLLTPRENPS